MQVVAKLARQIRARVGAEPVSTLPAAVITDECAGSEIACNYYMSYMPNLIPTRRRLQPSQLLARPPPRACGMWLRLPCRGDTGRVPVSAKRQRYVVYVAVSHSA